MKINVLVFPSGTEIGLEIHNALKWSTHIELFGTSSVSSNHGKYVYKNYIEEVPFVDDTEFINKINQLIDKYKIDCIFPAHDSAVLKFSEIQKDLYCKTIGSPVETCQICRSKKKTYEAFKFILSVPKVYEIVNEDIKFPVFIKPDVGQGSKGTYVATSREDVVFYLIKDPSLLILEYLPGKEYTIDCFTDRHSNLRFVGARERMRIMNGISVNTKPIFNNKFNKIAETINAVLKFRGVWFFQIKERIDGEFTLIEIAPRVAGSMGLYRNLGANLALLSVFDALDIDIQINYNRYSIEMDRALVNRFKLNLNYNNIYIDLDDTIINKEGVNPWIMALLYQSINKRKKIHLLSRHDGNIKDVLKKYRLEYVFDTITHIDKHQEKADYILDSSSILIDDSFSERQQVSQRLGIPTFDVSSVESLLDWQC